MYLKLQKSSQGGRIYTNHIELASKGIKDARTIKKHLNWLVKHDMLQDRGNHYKLTPQYILFYGKAFVSFDQDLLNNISTGTQCKALCLEIATEIKERQKLIRAKGFSYIDQRDKHRVKVRADEAILQQHNHSACDYMAQSIGMSKGEVCKLRKQQSNSSYKSYVLFVAKAKSEYDFLVFFQMMRDIKEFQGMKGGFYVHKSSLYFRTTSFRLSSFSFGRR